MHVVAMVPVKSTSRRAVGKNFRTFHGRPLYEHFFSRLDGLPFDQFFIDTDSPEVAAAARRRDWQVIERPPELATDQANGNDLLLYEAGLVESDIYVQLFVTAPLLRPTTIVRACQILLTEPDCDSVFTAVPIFSWFWFDGSPINYDPRVLPRSQDALPVIRETTGLYGIRRTALLERSCRIGAHPYILLVDELEALDIDTDIDFRIAELCYSLQEDGQREPTAIEAEPHIGHPLDGASLATDSTPLIRSDEAGPRLPRDPKP